jgi:hypothetical protein
VIKSNGIVPTKKGKNGNKDLPRDLTGDLRGYKHLP